MENPIDVFGKVYLSEFDKIRFEHFEKTIKTGNLQGKKILELGAGIGNHTKFLLKFNPSFIYCIEGRKINFDIIISNNFDTNIVQPVLWDLDNGLPEFITSVDIIYCYGTLYHLKNPFEFIEQIQKVRHDVLLLETCISAEGEINNIPENINDPSQSINGLGCRPNLLMLKEKLSKNYQKIIEPEKPKFVQFELDNMNSSPLKRIILFCQKTDLF